MRLKLYKQCWNLIVPIILTYMTFRSLNHPLSPIQSINLQIYNYEMVVSILFLFLESMSIWKAMLRILLTYSTR